MNEDPEEHQRGTTMRSRICRRILNKRGKHLTRGQKTNALNNGLASLQLSRFRIVDKCCPIPRLNCLLRTQLDGENQEARDRLNDVRMDSGLSRHATLPTRTRSPLHAAPDADMRTKWNTLTKDPWCSTPHPQDSFLEDIHTRPMRAVKSTIAKHPEVTATSPLEFAGSQNVAFRTVSPRSRRERRRSTYSLNAFDVERLPCPSPQMDTNETSKVEKTLISPDCSSSAGDQPYTVTSSHWMPEFLLDQHKKRVRWSTRSWVEAGHQKRLNQRACLCRSIGCKKQYALLQRGMVLPPPPAHLELERKDTRVRMSFWVQRIRLRPRQQKLALHVSIEILLTSGLMKSTHAQNGPHRNRAFSISTSRNREQKLESDTVGPGAGDYWTPPVARKTLIVSKSITSPCHGKGKAKRLGIESQSELETSSLFLGKTAADSGQGVDCEVKGVLCDGCTVSLSPIVLQFSTGSVYRNAATPSFPVEVIAFAIHDLDGFVPSIQWKQMESIEYYEEA
ncbi:uncharacterized protein MYCFIDRAFT_177538 [Pseudocercospora fijiensis CIRAD86]|uniref:Uncharacterized protein n=1 Tax=Pseudocercospora fijiensis (strain CIRAD86) TaxID=383855 RepID=M3ASZ1_PSEFD|nr:uncharacterized protein MYCFIDRAFT_177538 [Pseudocercospora fijiensis CIRAD86]EME80607.1 hypothetical protein MYCFIDRAFT_177538 [Pseudocercospora fijiensis CIRAD86]